MTNNEAIGVLGVIGLFAIDRANLNKESQNILEEAINKAILSLQAWDKTIIEITDFINDVHNFNLPTEALKHCLYIINKNLKDNKEGE